MGLARPTVRMGFVPGPDEDRPPEPDLWASGRPNGKITDCDLPSGLSAVMATIDAYAPCETGHRPPRPVGSRPVRCAGGRTSAAVHPGDATAADRPAARGGRRAGTARRRCVTAGWLLLRATGGRGTPVPQGDAADPPVLHRPPGPAFLTIARPRCSGPSWPEDRSARRCRRPPPRQAVRPSRTQQCCRSTRQSSHDRTPVLQPVRPPGFGWNRCDRRARCPPRSGPARLSWSPSRGTPPATPGPSSPPATRDAPGCTRDRGRDR